MIKRAGALELIGDTTLVSLNRIMPSSGKGRLLAKVEPTQAAALMALDHFAGTVVTVLPGGVDRYLSMVE